jgi:hypothetical protein
MQMAATRAAWGRKGDSYQPVNKRGRIASGLSCVPATYTSCDQRF